jgi:hypothetical protein
MHGLLIVFVTNIIDFVPHILRSPFRFGLFGNFHVREFLSRLGLYSLNNYTPNVAISHSESLDLDTKTERMILPLTCR